MKTEKFQLKGKSLGFDMEAERVCAAANNRRAELDRRQYRYTFHIPERRHLVDRRETGYLRLCSWAP
ncbi:MAG: hypothetical protein HF981_06500 [Desulfobacteraceae bacterium]|nr:hypothetical protein [Desulfobacteraceae bacterium]MBC2750019.1 hypothetical protein [Desulfobacteraceae bacterium]